MNQSGILFPVAEEISHTETDLIAMIKTTGKEKDYELIEYILDVNTQYTQVLMELNENGAMDVAYTYGTARLTEDRFTGESNFYLYDPSGNVAGITDQNGYLWQSYRYDAFGNATFGSPQYDNEYTFNAESYNPNIHSQYLRARYYDTVKGSFLTEDTYLGDIRKPLTRNRYSYCIGNPLFYCDPSGHAPQNVIDQVVIDFLEDTKNSRLHDYDLYEAYNARLEFYDILDQEGIWDRMGRSTEEQRISYMKKYNFAKSGLNVKKWVDEAKLQAKKYGCEEMRVSSQGIEMIANFELSKGAAEAWEIGEFDENGELIGIYPHYVFKEVNGKFQSDGGITFGYGHIVSQWDYDNNSNEKTLADKYAFGAIFKPEKVPNDGVPYKVPDSSYMPIEEAKKLMMPDIEKCETALNDFLLKNGIKLNQNQFDALISFSYQYGENWWTKEEKKLPEFLLGGKGTYDEEEVRRVFALHDNKDRRAIEAEVFINGYK